MPIPHWNEPGGDDSWDTLILGGQFIPCTKAEVECDISWKLDIKKPKGADGFQMTDEGQEAGPVTIRLTFTTSDELSEFQKVLADIRPPRKGGKRDPLEIQHPSANVLGVKAIVIEKIHSGQPSATDGWIVTISAKEWVKGPKDKKGLGGAKGGAGKGNDCASLAAQAQHAESEIAYLTSQHNYAVAKGDPNAPAIMQSLVLATQKRDTLVAALEKCKGTAAPPSKTAKGNVL